MSKNKKAPPRLDNIEKVRNHMLEILEQLDAGDIDVVHAGIVSKACEGIMSSAKLQLSYSAMIGDTPMIPFLQDCHDSQQLKLPKPTKEQHQ